MLAIREVSILSPDAESLIAALDNELSEEYAPEHRHGVKPSSFHDEGGVFVVAFDQARPVACGALRPIDNNAVELKRMFVLAAFRGRGFSREVLTHLEEKARSLGFGAIRLETGDQQHTAIGLYTRSGYQRIPAFGEYENSPRSVCFEKQL